MKWVVGGVVVVLVIVVVLWMKGALSSDDEYPKTSEKSMQPENVLSEKAIVTAEQKSKVIEYKDVNSGDGFLSSPDISYSETSVSQSKPVTPHSVESALNSMREGLAEGDSRTPALSEPSDYEQPSLDELNDPVLYQQYEKRQSLNQASAYFSAAVKELPVLRAKIAQARQNGGQTEEEIQEAEEALQKLELMQLEYQWQMPEASKADIPDE